MVFEGFIPDNESEESVYYAQTVTVDSDGIDLRLYGETYSASFQEVDKVEVAMAILEDDFSHLEERAEIMLKLGAFSSDSLEELGWVYMRAAQLQRLDEVEFFVAEPANA